MNIEFKIGVDVKKMVLREIFDDSEYLRNFGMGEDEIDMDVFIELTPYIHDHDLILNFYENYELSDGELKKLARYFHYLNSKKFFIHSIPTKLFKKCI